MADTSRHPAESAGGPAIAFENVSVAREGLTILEHVSAVVPRGGFTAIIGPNGAGKTTLLLALLGETAYEGNIRVRSGSGRERCRIGYVPQHLTFDRGMPVTVIEFLVMGLQRRPLWFGVSAFLKQRAIESLASVEAAYLASRRIGALSGGEMQRVLLALALLQDPELLILDEPSAGVDFQGGQVFCRLLDQLRLARGFTQLMVSHDLAMVTHHATHVICLNRRVHAAGPPREALSRETLTAIFGVHMGVIDARAMSLKPDADDICFPSECREDRND